MEALSDRGSTPLASTTIKACDCYKITGFFFVLRKCQKNMFRSGNCAFDLTPNFTPYRSETALNRPSIRFCESFRMVSETAAYTSIVKALE